MRTLTTHEPTGETERRLPTWALLATPEGPDGRSIAFVKGGLYRMPAAGGRPRLLVGKSSFARVAIAGIADLSWSPEGRRFGFTANKAKQQVFSIDILSPIGRLR